MSDFNAGFRLSFTDIIVLVIGISGAGFFYNINPLISAIVAFVLAHFFLFCNIIRISRIPELIWAAIFLILVGSSLRFNKPELLVAFSISLATTLILVILEFKKPSYHGILWQKINPSLLQWFEQNRSKQP